MHPYERWTIRRYLANALKSTRLARPPSADRELFPWIDSPRAYWVCPSWLAVGCRQDEIIAPFSGRERCHRTPGGCAMHCRKLASSRRSRNQSPKQFEETGSPRDVSRKVSCPAELL
jgi:hypothetical protein